ncbi:MAG: hypothetical protein SFX73_35980 [Kofleriaceae bacterium]|nr:hypothetical protein [Kofleriaceae bacterium]
MREKASGESESASMDVEQDATDRQTSREANDMAWVLKRVTGGKAASETRAPPAITTAPRSILVTRDCKRIVQDSFDPALYQWSNGVPPPGLFAQEPDGSFTFITTIEVFQQMVARSFVEAGDLYTVSEHQALSDTMENRINALNRRNPNAFRAIDDPNLVDITSTLPGERKDMGEWAQYLERANSGAITDQDRHRHDSAYWGTIQALVGSVDASGGALGWGATNQPDGRTTLARQAGTDFYAEPAPRNQQTNQNPTNQNQINQNPTNQNQVNQNPTNQDQINQNPTSTHQVPATTGGTEAGVTGELTGGQSWLYDLDLQAWVSSAFKPAEGQEGVYVREKGAIRYVTSLSTLHVLTCVNYAEGPYRGDFTTDPGGTLQETHQGLAQALENTAGGDLASVSDKALDTLLTKQRRVNAYVDRDNLKFVDANGNKQFDEGEKQNMSDYAHAERVAAEEPGKRVEYVKSLKDDPLYNGFNYARFQSAERAALQVLASSAPLVIGSQAMYWDAVDYIKDSTNPRYNKGASGGNHYLAVGFKWGDEYHSLNYVGPTPKAGPMYEVVKQVGTTVFFKKL